MSFIEDVVVTNQNSHANMHWSIGVVTAYDPATKLCTVALGPDDNQMFVSGAGVPGVAKLDQYTPTLGDMVHMLVYEPNGMVILGSAGRIALNKPLPPAAGGTEPDPLILTAPGISPNENEVVQGAQVGDAQSWYFPTLFDLIAQAESLGLVVGFRISVTMLTGGPKAGFVLVNLNGDVPVTGSSDGFFSVDLALGVPETIDIPLGWVEQIGLNANYTVGVQAVGSASPATFDPSAVIELLIDEN